MDQRRDDSLITSLRQIYQMEEDRLLADARRRADAERAEAERRERARQEARQASEARARAIEVERARTLRDLEVSRGAVQKERQERELALRAEIEAALQTELAAQQRVHNAEIAEIETRRHRGVPMGRVATILVGLTGMLCLTGYLGVYRPLVHAHADRITDLQRRTRSAQDEAVLALQRLHQAQTEAPRAVAQPTPLAHVEPPTPRNPITHSVPGTRHLNPGHPGTPPAIDPLLELDGNPDLGRFNDVTRTRSSRHR